MELPELFLDAVGDQAAPGRNFGMVRCVASMVAPSHRTAPPSPTAGLRLHRIGWPSCPRARSEAARPHGHSGMFEPPST